MKCDGINGPVERSVAGNVHVGAVDRGIRDKVMLLVRVGVFRRHHSNGGKGDGIAGGCAGRVGLIWGSHGD